MSSDRATRRSRHRRAGRDRATVLRLRVDLRLATNLASNMRDCGPGIEEEEKDMTRSIAALAVALGCSCVIGVSAQDTKTTTTTKTEGGKATSVTYTGCMQTGTETRSVVLAKVQPVSRTTETSVGTSGVTTTTTTTYALVPDE